MECPKTNCNLMIYRVENQWLYKTSPLLGQVPDSVRLPESDSGNARLSDREGVTLPSSCPVTTHPWYLVLAVCLPHAYLLPKP